MKNIVLTELKGDKESSMVITRLKKTVGPQLNLNRSKDIENATTLCVYWYVTEKRHAAQALLDKIVFNISYSGNESLWSVYCQALLLRAQIAADDGDTEFTNRVVSVIEKEDIISIKRVDNFISDRGVHLEALSVAEIETQKYQCEIYAQGILLYLYDKFMIPLERQDFAEAVDQEINDGIELNSKYLREALVAKRKANKH